MKNTLLFSLVLCALLITGCAATSDSSTHDMKHDSSMTMDDMMSMLEGKTGDAFDAAFIEAMIPHHQGAIDMANAALKNAKHKEIQQMAKAIISAQQKEIDTMKQWQKNWGYTK